ncbi:defensin-1-like [Prosopis cineraria]|uniref:defensin-1-like n=1 Tax=Prosopis cineraria TaxID=364024 RepID=UPI00240F715D|nr:defensin-1-like [Prosopis cineraria]
MAASLLKLSSFIAFLCIALLVSSPNENVEAVLCGRLSGRFIGNCIDSVQCNDTRRTEGAVAGNCLAHGLGFACFCYYNCKK